MDTQINKLDDSFQDCDINAGQQTDQQMDLSTDPLTDHPATAGTVHTIHHTILDQISEAIADMQVTMKTTKTDKVSTGTTIETEGTNRTQDTTRGTGFKTGMTVTKIEIGLTTRDDQININTTETSPEHR